MSNHIKVQSIILVYEIDGRETGWSYKDPKPTVIVRSHGIMDDRVCLVFDDGDGTVGHAYTVIASDLLAAVQNARNAG